MEVWIDRYQMNPPTGIKVPMPPKTVRLQIVERTRQRLRNWVWMLNNFIAGMGKDDKDSVIAALYIAQSFGLIEAAEDFKPYGRARIESKILSRLTYLVTEMWASSSFSQKPIKKSYPYQLGLIFRGFEKFSDKIPLAALYLAYDGQKLMENEATIGEEALNAIKARIAKIKKKFKII